MTHAPVQATGLKRRFGAIEVIRDLTITVERGTAHGVVGLNGAGKTTLFRLLLGLLRPDTGEIRVCGYNPWRHERAFLQSCGAVLEHDGFSGGLTFLDNLLFFADARGVSRVLMDEYLERWWPQCTWMRSNRRVRELSRGQRMQAALCRAFLGWPPVCILDEPTAGLDVDATDHFFTLISEAKRRGSAALISSHHLAAIERLCDSVDILADGCLSRIADLSKEHGARWIVRATGKGSLADVLISRGMRVIESDDGSCTFSPPNGPGDIAGCVRALVESGWDISEVRECGRDIESAIRRNRAGAQAL